MNESQLRIIFVFTDLVLPLLTGYYLHQRKIISDRLCNRLISFNIIWICTLLSLLSFWVLPLTAELLWLPAFSFIFAAIPGMISILTFARQHKEPLDRGAYIISSLLANIGTLGGLCAFILYGETGFAYAQLVVTFQNLILMLGCFPLAQYYYALHTAAKARKHLHINVKDLFLSWNQLSVLGMLVGMLLQAAAVPRPESLGGLFNGLIHLSAWTALLPVGYLVDFHQAGQYYRRILDLLPLRFIILPAITYFIIKQLFTDQVLLGSLMIFASSPTAINAVLTARIYKLNVDLTIAAFLLTTALFLLLIYPCLFFYVQLGHLW
mgnify:CR=1 FL=1